jgi:hypothetical protein
LCPENYLVNGFLFDNVPVVRLSRLIKLPQHRGIAGIFKGGLKIGFDKVEKSPQVRVAPVLGLLFSSFGYFVEE